MNLFSRASINPALALLIAAALASGCSSAISKRGGESDSGASRASTKVESDVDREFQKGIAYLQGERYQEAEAVLANLSRLQPTLTGPHANLGLVYLRTERFAEAAAEFQRMIELQPQNPDGYNYLGVAHRHAGEFDKAREAYEKALQINTNYAPAHLNLGILFDLYTNEPDKALNHYRKYQQLAGTDDKQVAIWIADVERRTSGN